MSQGILQFSNAQDTTALAASLYRNIIIQVVG